ARAGHLKSPGDERIPHTSLPIIQSLYPIYRVMAATETRIPQDRNLFIPRKWYCYESIGRYSVYFPCFLACIVSGLTFRRDHLPSHLRLLAEEGRSKAMSLGISNSNSVPAPTTLQTLSRSPISSDLSRIPLSPQCPSRPERKTCGSIPQPSSRTRIRNCLDPYSSTTSMFLAREWRKALTNASRPIRYASSRMTGCKGRE